MEIEKILNELNIKYEEITHEPLFWPKIKPKSL